MRTGATLAFAAAGAFATAWSAGWFATPRVIFTSPLPVETELDARAFRLRADLVVRDAEWRPLAIGFTMAPRAGAASRPASPVTLTTAAGLRRQVVVAEAAPVTATLDRVRGAGPNDALTLTTGQYAGPILVRELRGSYPVHWTMLVTLGYGAWLGAWFWRAIASSRHRVPAPAPRVALTGAAGAAALVVFGLGILAFRKPDAILVPQLWAEDGRIFFTDAWNEGPRALLQPYAGYLHAFPRLVAEASVHVAPALVPLVFLAASLLPVVLVAGLLASARLPLNPRERLGCMALLVLPPAPGEVFLNVTNAQWVLAFAPVLLLVATPPRTARAMAADVGVLAWAGLTGPFSLVFVPLFVARALWTRGVATAVPAFAVAACAAVQGGVLAVSGRLTPGQPVPVDLMVANLGRRFLALWHLSASEDAGFLAGTVLAALIVLFVGALLLERARVAALWTGAGLLAIGGIMLGTRAVDYGLAAGGERYFSLPVGLMLWGCLAGRRAYPRLGAALIAAVLLLTTPTLLVAPLRDLRWTEASACLSRPGPCTIPINPVGWTLHVTGRQEH